MINYKELLNKAKLDGSQIIKGKQAEKRFMIEEAILAWRVKLETNPELIFNEIKKAIGRGLNHLIIEESKLGSLYRFPVSVQKLPETSMRIETFFEALKQEFEGVLKAELECCRSLSLTNRYLIKISWD